MEPREINANHVILCMITTNIGDMKASVIREKEKKEPPRVDWGKGLTQRMDLLMALRDFKDCILAATYL